MGAPIFKMKSDRGSDRTPLALERRRQQAPQMPEWRLQQGL
jgi:hypothetical protein